MKSPLNHHYITIIGVGVIGSHLEFVVDLFHLAGMFQQLCCQLVSKLHALELHSSLSCLCRLIQDWLDAINGTPGQSDAMPRWKGNLNLGDCGALDATIDDWWLALRCLFADTMVKLLRLWSSIDQEFVNEAQDLYSVAGPEVPSQIYTKTMHSKKGI